LDETRLEKGCSIPFYPPFIHTLTSYNFTIT